MMTYIILFSFEELMLNCWWLEVRDGLDPFKLLIGISYCLGAQTVLV
jgi:hypothetical protein